MDEKTKKTGETATTVLAKVEQEAGASSLDVLLSRLSAKVLRNCCIAKRPSSSPWPGEREEDEPAIALLVILGYIREASDDPVACKLAKTRVLSPLLHSLERARKDAGKGGLDAKAEVEVLEAKIAAVEDLEPPSGYVATRAGVQFANEHKWDLPGGFRSLIEEIQTDAN